MHLAWLHANVVTSNREFSAPGCWLSVGEAVAVLSGFQGLGFCPPSSEHRERLGEHCRKCERKERRSE